MKNEKFKFAQRKKKAISVKHALVVKLMRIEIKRTNNITEKDLELVVRRWFRAISLQNVGPDRTDNISTSLHWKNAKNLTGVRKIRNLFQCQISRVAKRMTNMQLRNKL